MSSGKLTDAIRNASAVNLRYSASLVSLAREYVKALGEAVMPAEPGPPTDEAPPAGAPLLLAGRTGETANAAFVIKGGPNLPETLTLVVKGDFADTKVWTDPKTLALRDGNGAVTRILAKIGRKTEAERDMAGEVVIAELDRKVTDFVVRKLLDA